ncbi:MAG TPA: hypothetical protein VF855_02525 [Acidimicrobiales bacterium]
MTTTDTATTPTQTTPTDTPTDTAAAIDRFLAAIAAGTPDSSLVTPDCTIDATVPNWRFQARGAIAATSVLQDWYANPARYEELDRVPVPGGEIVTFFLTWQERGMPFAAHQAHVIAVRDGRIASDKVFCGGRWNAQRLAEMGAAADAH